MPITPWGEDPSTFHEPWCLECGAERPSACRCNPVEEVERPVPPLDLDQDF